MMTTIPYFRKVKFIKKKIIFQDNVKNSNYDKNVNPNDNHTDENEYSESEYEMISIIQCIQDYEII